MTENIDKATLEIWRDRRMDDMVVRSRNDSSIDLFGYLDSVELVYHAVSTGKLSSSIDPKNLDNYVQKVMDQLAPMSPEEKGAIMTGSGWSSYLYRQLKKGE